MRLLPEEIESFQRIWKNLFNEELSLAQAEEEAEHLLSFMTALRDRSPEVATRDDDSLQEGPRHGRMEDKPSMYD